MDDDNMDIDVPSNSTTTSTTTSSNDSNKLKPIDRIIKRLLEFGIPKEVFDGGCSGLVTYVEESDKRRLPEIVFHILPANEEVREALYQCKSGSKHTAARLTMKNQFRESMVWLQWLMFRGDPQDSLKCLAEKSAGQRGVCGAVWGTNDIAYRCRTCEHDPTCAICVPCFQNGDHKDHDYSVIYTGGGCCDCGDATAWKREGFCSKHRGAEQIQPLPKEFADSVELVLQPLFINWRERILYLESITQKNTLGSDHIVEHQKLANELTFAVVEMLLEFCKYSESLLSFVSSSVSSVDGLLGCLVRAEGLLMQSVVKKLHELLLKLLADPVFKYEFSKVFLKYYPFVISEIIKESNDDAVKKYPLLSTFAVQIFTVPTLTPQLVKEMNLLETLLGCLGDIFNSCAGEDGRLQLSKWTNLFEITLRVVEDIRFVMSHDVVPKYVTQFQGDVLKSWMRLLAFVQEMNPQKRETGIHIEEENENTHLPFLLCNSINNIHSLLVNGASSSASDENCNEGFSNSDRQDMDDGDNQRHAKVGRLSQEFSVGTPSGRCSMSASSSKIENECDFCHSFIAPSVAWLTHECARAIVSGLVVDNSPGSSNDSAQGTCNMSASNFLAWKKTFAKFRRGKNIFSRLNSLKEGPSYSLLPASAFSGPHMSSDLLHSQSTDQEEDFSSTSCSTDPGLDKTEVACAADDALRLLNMADWPDISYDVSSQEVSVHIPFHRLLSLLLQKALKRCYGESAVPSMDNPVSLNEPPPNLLNHLLSGYHAYGFSAFIMELPLRIRVFFAEVHAGMWRRNGDAPLVSWECYRSIRWSGQDLDLDLLLLQCCAAMAPADVYLTRLLERFGLSAYLSLSLGQYSEYEPTLVQEMLTLIIQIVKERRFSGLSIAESLKRELVCKLATGDATRSQLIKSLPRDLSKSVELQETLDAVAQYSNPSGFNQGMYSLRRAYWKELDLYHPRWSSRDLQLAEERYSRFCGAFALTTQLPRWTPIYYPLKAVARVATCKAAVVMIRAVLFYAVFSDKKTESRASDSVVLTALHFLSLGLDICSQHREDSELSCYDGDVMPLLAFSGEEIDEDLLSGAEGVGGHSLLSLLVSLMRMHKKERLDMVLEAGNYNLSALIECLLKKFVEMDRGCMTKLQQLAPEVVSDLVQHVPQDEKRKCERVSDSEKRKAKARERQAAILAKMKAEQSKFLKSLDNADDKESESGQKCGVTLDLEESQDSCALCHDPNSRVPLCYLVHLQKSRLLSFTNRGTPSWEYANSSKKNQIFIRGNSGYSQTPVNSLPSSSEGASSISEGVPLDVVQNMLNVLGNNGQPGEAEAFLRLIKDRLPSARNIQAPSKSMHKEERAVSNFEVLEGKLYTSIIQAMHDHMEQLDSMEDVKEDLTTEEDPNKESKSFLPVKYIAALSRNTSEICSSSDDKTQNDSSSKLSLHSGFGPADCDGIYISSCGHAVHQGCLDRYLSSLKERYVRRVIFEGGHIVDPDQGEFLCPVCRGLANAILPALPGELNRGSCSLDATGPLTLANQETCPLSLEHAICILRCAGNAFRHDETLRAFPVHRNENIRPDVGPISRMLFKMYFPGKQDRFLRSSRINHSMIMWDTFKYSLVSIEIAARSGRKSLKPIRGVHALYRELDTSNGFTLSLLLKIVQSTRSSHYLHVIQRFRGMQLLAESICSGHSLDYFCNPSVNSDYMLDFLRLVESDLSYPDIQFWDRASDPILARDPFSSLMWVLFCLPYPFLSCEKTFLSLVHLFYVVSVTQAIIALSDKVPDMMDDLYYNSCLATEIFKFVEKFGYARQYVMSNHINASHNVKDIISSLSLPFLRRCALLWRLLISSTAAPFRGVGEVVDGSSNATADLVDNEQECGEIEELQRMFKIPPLDLVLNDQSISPLVFKWCTHLYKDSELRSFTGTMTVTPAVPFKLMELPHLYQDLLQRYIKQCCPDCKAPLTEPALCLLCGRLCSPSRKSCCRKSGCQSHAMDCGAGTGVFLLIKRTTILLQRSARQAPWPSPYLDAFGEEDIEMQRGKPLYLNEERYAALTYMVASHGLDQSSKVLRQTTIGSFFLV